MLLQSTLGFLWRLLIDLAKCAETRSDILKKILLPCFLHGLVEILHQRSVRCEVMGCPKGYLNDFLQHTEELKFSCNNFHGIAFQNKRNRYQEIFLR